MLEHAALWIAPGTQSASGATRLISDANAQLPLGHALWPAERGPRWFPWARPTRFFVYESPDDALLLSSAQPWRKLGSRTVLDADDNEIGLITGTDVLSARGEWLAARFKRGPGGQFISPAEAELASWEIHKGGMRLQFLPPATDPWLRMCLLAAVLSL